MRSTKNKIQAQKDKLNELGTRIDVNDYALEELKRKMEMLEMFSHSQASQFWAYLADLEMRARALEGKKKSRKRI